jgi:hypothetical protein
MNTTLYKKREDIPDYNELLENDYVVFYNVSFELEVGALLRKTIRVSLSKIINEIKQMDSDFEASFEEFKGFLSSTFLVRAKGDKRVVETCLSIKEWAN